MTNTNVLCRMGWHDYQTVIDWEDSKIQKPKTKHVEDEKGLHYGSSYGTTKATPDEDDDETEFHVAKILRKSVVEFNF